MTGDREAWRGRWWRARVGVCLTGVTVVCEDGVKVVMRV